MEHMDSASLYSEQHTITAHHLTNRDGELVVFRREREALGNNAETADEPA